MIILVICDNFGYQLYSSNILYPYYIFFNNIPSYIFFNTKCLVYILSKILDECDIFSKIQSHWYMNYL